MTVITGLGIIAPNGLGTERYWDATLSGRSGIGELDRFDTTGYPSRLAGLVRDFDAAQYLPGRLLPQTDICTRLALTAAGWAIEDAGLDTAAVRDYDMSVVTANASGGFEFTHREFRKLWTRGPEHVSVYESFAWFYAVNTGQISIRHGMRGPSCALVTEQAGGLDALGQARRTIRAGTRVVVGGGADSAFDPWGALSQTAGGRVSADPDPATAYRPFDTRAAGYLPGEGSAILVLEATESARARGARAYGELAGYAATFDPAPGSDRPPGLGRAASLALADAGITPAEVDVVFADAAGLPELDRSEALALRELFGAGGVPVTAPKSLTGRVFSGGGTLDVVCALMSIRDGVIPPTFGTRSVPAEYGLDLVLGTARQTRVDTALVLARGRWGFNAAVVIRSVEKGS
ncbi:putative Actinorhodin polyketide beta-ketoacyl synthase 2 [Frankia canadensis]|uniref:Putative Actinorhodin polyketide beta-ketoacyl synthase 2 n=1 Tax=Frankia canadensis TaxID=1836972 RepID=A0A2I2KS75_9ACTN|nr:ketosynthase chain-length factor [Frankia canadensis]SNQ48496.1 putative Actinorhodin polyketide beta-ketoacyl synthase 2 [Frankia canadensis]SOU55786.1 putative Actinorhodin polyketide beta-ketoacyl synthase 2 [Frankia canadensis]